jgi:hypothetical protein
MNHYTVRAIKGKRCVRRVDSWTIVNARNISERLLSEFPGALVQIYGRDNKIVPPAEQGISRGPSADGSSNAPESGSWRVLAFPKKLQN